MRSYMVAALLMANRGGSGSSGGTHSGGGTGPSTAVGAGGSGTGTGGSFSPDGTENATRTTRNGRGATTQTTPTRWDEDAVVGRRKGRGSCRNCCDACEGNVPATWTVTVPGAYGPVVLQRVTNSFGSAYCIWEWNGRQTSGCAGSPWMGRVELQIYVAATVDGPKYDQVLRVYPDPNAAAIWSWTNRNETQPHDCLVAMDPTWSGGTCADPGDPTVTPGARSKCCPCTICCSACGDDYTPASWNVTIDGQRFNVPRALDDDTDVSNVATCVWRKAINQDVCDLAAKWIEIRVINDTNVGAAFPYYLECELIEADETSHTLWRKSTAMALACGAASHELTKVSGECAGNVTVESVNLNLCQDDGGGGSVAGQCVCCQLDDDTDEYDIDFGAAGFLEDNLAYETTGVDCNVTICDNCDLVGGVYTVARFVNCSWLYTEQVCGDRTSFLILRAGTTAITCTNDSTTLTVSLSKVSQLAQCYWKVRASIHYACTSSSEISDGILWAEWRSALADPDTACDLSSPLTLNKHSENDEWSQCGGMAANAPTACGGAWPSTITIQSV